VASPQRAVHAWRPPRAADDGWRKHLGRLAVVLDGEIATANSQNTDDTDTKETTRISEKRCWLIRVGSVSSVSSVFWLFAVAVRRCRSPVPSADQTYRM